MSIYNKLTKKAMFLKLYLIFEFAMVKIGCVPIFMQFEEPLIFSGFDLFLGPFGYSGVERVKAYFDIYNPLVAHFHGLCHRNCTVRYIGGILVLRKLDFRGFKGQRDVKKV